MGDMGAERRKHERVRCNFACFIETKKEPVRALVLDVSDGGLQIETDVTPPEQGFPLLLTLRPPKGKTIRIEGLVWHVKESRKRGQKSIGLVLSNAPDEYFSMVASLRESSETKAGRRLVRPPQKRPAETNPLPEEPKSADSGKEKEEATVPRVGLPKPERRLPGLKRHAIRVKQSGGPRTCRLVVAASNPDEAKELALSEVGAGWDVLGVTPL